MTLSQRTSHNENNELKILKNTTEKDAGFNFCFSL